MKPIVTDVYMTVIFWVLPLIFHTIVSVLASMKVPVGKDIQNPV